MPRETTEESGVIKTVKICLFAAIAVLVGGAYAGQAEDAIAERIKPVGEVCVQGQECSVATTATATASGPRSGKDVFDGACMACHATGAGGAPKVGDAAAWSARIAKGIDALYASGLNGVPGTGMMAMGTCMTCSEDEIKAAVDYMVENSK